MAPNFLIKLICLVKFLHFASGNKLLVIVIDGIRWDQAENSSLPGLAAFRRSGAKELIPNYPSNGFPNYFSMITGLNPETHGITDDVLFDDETKSLFTRGIVYGNRARTKWYRGGSGILWHLARKQGVKTAWYNWPGCTVKGTPEKPEHCQPFEGAYHPPVFSRQLKQIMKDLKNNRTDAAFLYTDVMSKIAERHGPGSELFRQALFEIDWQIKLLHDNLRRAQLLNSTNVIITSPFGYRSPSSAPKFINLSWIMPDVTDRARIISFGNRAGVWPKRGRFAQQFTRLYRNSHGLKVYWRHNTPKEWGVREGPFQPPITLVAPDGWRIAANRQEIITIMETGEAEGGLDPYEVREMRGFLIASGPDIGLSMPVPSMRINDVYVLLCRLLKLTPAPNNGTLQGLKNIAIIVRQGNFTDQGGADGTTDVSLSTTTSTPRTTSSTLSVTTETAQTSVTTSLLLRLTTTIASTTTQSTAVHTTVSTTTTSNVVATPTTPEIPLNGTEEQPENTTVIDSMVETTSPSALNETVAATEAPDFENTTYVNATDEFLENLLNSTISTEVTTSELEAVTVAPHFKVQNGTGVDGETNDTITTDENPASNVTLVDLTGPGDEFIDSLMNVTKMVEPSAMGNTTVEEETWKNRTAEFETSDNTTSEAVLYKKVNSVGTETSNTTETDDLVELLGNGSGEIMTNSEPSFRLTNATAVDNQTATNDTDVMTEKSDVSIDNSTYEHSVSNETTDPITEYELLVNQTDELDIESVTAPPDLDEILNSLNVTETNFSQISNVTLEHSGEEGENLKTANTTEIFSVKLLESSNLTEQVGVVNITEVGSDYEGVENETNLLPSNVISSNVTEELIDDSEEALELLANGTLSSSSELSNYAWENASVDNDSANATYFENSTIDRMETVDFAVATTENETNIEKGRIFVQNVSAVIEVGEFGNGSNWTNNVEVWKEPEFVEILNETSADTAIDSGSEVQHPTEYGNETTAGNIVFSKNETWMINGNLTDSGDNTQGRYTTQGADSATGTPGETEFTPTISTDGKTTTSPLSTSAEVSTTPVYHYPLDETDNGSQPGGNVEKTTKTSLQPSKTTSPFETTTILDLIGLIRPMEASGIFESIQCNCTALLQQASILDLAQLEDEIDDEQVYFATNIDLPQVSLSTDFPQVQITKRREIYVLKEESSKTVETKTVRDFTTYGPVTQRNLTEIVVTEMEHKLKLKVFKGEVMCLHCYE